MSHPVVPSQEAGEPAITPITGDSALQRAIEPQAAERIAELLSALADPLRIRIVSVIATSGSGEASAGEIASIAAVTPSTVSHHLRVLKDAGVVATERRGTWIYYRFTTDTLRSVLPLLENLAVPTTSDDTEAAQKSGHGRRSQSAPVDHETALAHISERLTERFPAMGQDLVTRTVRESYAALLRTASIDRYIPVLAERFARQRLEDIGRTANARHLTTGGGDRRPQVLFVCVANAGRSQLAAALLHRYAGDRVVVRSAGTQPARGVHATVLPLLAEIVGSDAVDETVFPKPLTDDAVRAADIVVTLGCGDNCPVLPGKRYEDWAVGDPALASPEGVRAIRDDLDRRVRALLADLLPDVSAEPIDGSASRGLTARATRSS